jgi:hypothetical protein
MPNSQPLRTFEYLTRVAGAKSLVASKCTTATTGPVCTNKQGLLTSNKLPQSMRLINENLGKLACCDCGPGCKASKTKLLGRTPGCGCCRA